MNGIGLCYVVGAMPLAPSLVPRPEPEDLLIAADRGFEALSACSLVPDLVVGDYDSLGYRPDHPAAISLPVMKDDTDTIFALRKGLKRGFRRFVLLGCLGGRLDHTMASLQTLNWLSTWGADSFLADEGTAVTVLRSGTIRFPSGMKGRISVFASGGTATGVNLQGLKYPLHNYALSDNFPLGVSNEFVGKKAVVSVRTGTLYITWDQPGADFYKLLPSLWPEPLRS